jgi:hypothetical protein
MSKSQNTKNEQQNDLCITSEQLTEQYKHGNLPDDRLYYYRFKGEPEVQITTQYGLYCEEADNKKEIEVIDFVPSYEEYLCLTYAKEEDEKIIAEYEEENTKLKDLLKEIRGKINTIYDIDLNEFITSAAFSDDFVKKIDEVLNAK